MIGWPGQGTGPGDELCRQTTKVLTADVVTAIIMCIGLIGVLSAVQKKQAIQCACLGTEFNLPMSVVTIIENSVMIVMAIAMFAM